MIIQLIWAGLKIIDKQADSLTDMAIGSYIKYHELKEKDTVAIKTKKVVLKDGREGRGVKVTPTNYVDVTNSIIGTEAWGIVKVAPGGEESNHRVKIHTKKGYRVANVGDTVVKLGNGDYIVIKLADFEKFVQI